MKVKLKKTFMYILAVVMLLSMLPAQYALADPVLSVSLGNATLTDGKYYYEDALVSGDGIRTIFINFSGNVTSGDAITLPTAPEDFTVSSSSNNYTKRINLPEGTLTTAVESYLRGVGVAVTSANQTVSVTVTTESIQQDTFYNIDKQHYYQFVPLLHDTETWITSYNAAKGMTYMGRSGYLATVTSVEEDTFIMDLSGEVGWLGGTRMVYDPDTDSFSTGTTTGYWYWANGPEKGDHFYDAQYVTSADYAEKDSENADEEDYYFNWNRPASGDKEPNSQEADEENCLTTLHIGTGYAGTTGYSWNDRDYDANYWDDTTSVYQPHGYIVEYGDSPVGDSGDGSAAFASGSGALIDPTVIDLTTVTRTSLSTYTCDIDLPVSAKMVTISVDSGYFTVPSIDGGVLTFLGGTNGTSYISAFNTSTLYASAVFSFSDPSAAANLLDDIIYTPGSATAQTITATSSAASPTGSDLYFDGHFYRYVAGSINWPAAVIAAGGTTDPYFGGSGYIATATSQAENSILLRLTSTTDPLTDGYYDAYMGGLWQRNTGTVEAPSITQGTDEHEITYANIVSANSGGTLTSLLPDYSDTYGSVDNIYESSDTVKYYWVDGPEAGWEIENNVTGGFLPWHSGEPNTGDFVYIGWQGAYWDDQSADVSAVDSVYAAVDGYIVEFSGFGPGGSTAGIVKSDEKTVNAAYAITYHLVGGTNPGGAPASYVYGTGATLPTPTKAGFAFVGWYADADFSGDQVTALGAADTGAKEYFARWTAIPAGGTPARTIAVTETSSDLFSESAGAVLAQANMENAFSNSVEVKVTDTNQEEASFGFGAGTDVYPFDISLYVKGTNTKTEPASGYAVTISLPIPEELLDVREKLFIVHRSEDGTVTTLASSLKQISGVWYLVFEANDFSPYALAVRNLISYDAAAGLPYYLDDSGSRVFIGFAANGSYLAPDGATVLFMPNPKSFTDIAAHWGKPYIDFVTEREIFVGTGADVFSPDTGMTRAMFATVIGRLYERSYGEISLSDARAFTDCKYDSYYGKYVDWAAENGVIEGVGGGLFQPDHRATRQEMAAMLYRFAQFMKLSTGTSDDAVLRYSDASGIASWAENAALYCQETGIITGRDGGHFAPTEIAARAEVAAIIQRFVELALE